MSMKFSVECDGVTRTYALKRAVVTFGRSKASTVAVEDATLSRTHCQIESEGDEFFVRDLNSRNGTLVNGHKSPRARIKPGDRVQIGNTTITLLDPDLDTSPLEGGRATQRWTARLFEHGKKKKTPRPPTEDAGEEVRRLHRLLTINKKIAAEIDGERVLSLILDSAVDFINAERGFLVVLEEKTLRIPVARDFWRKDIPTPAFELSRSIAQEVVRRGEPLVTENASEDVRLDEMASVHALKLRSVLCVPLKAFGKTIGALYLDNRLTDGSFGEKDVAILEAFADQVAISLVNAGRFRATAERADNAEKEASELEREVIALRARLAQSEKTTGLTHGFGDIVGRSEAMLECLAEVDRKVDAQIPIVLIGERGTGKELIARARHAAGRRAKDPFVTVIGPDLKWVADDGQTGDLQSFPGGTLFIKEIADLDLDAQKELLHALRAEDGGDDDFGKGLIVATARDPIEAIEDKALREDLWTAIRAGAIEVPPLRRRRGDVPLLVSHFLRVTDPPASMAPRALKLLSTYSWPGNVRELKDEIQRASTLSDGVIHARDLSPHMQSSGRSIDDLEGGLKAHVERVERDYVVQVLEKCGDNKSKAAEMLGLSRLGLRKKMARYGIVR